MTREEHNAHWKVDRQPEDTVFCNTLGYGEISQYDPECASCWLGHSHTWEKHDASLMGARAAKEEHRRRAAQCRSESTS